MFCCRLPEVVFQNLLVVFRFHDSLTLMRFPVPNALKHPHSIILPLPCFTLETFWKCVLWVEHLNSFSKHRQHLYGQRALFLFHLTKGHVSSMYSFFSPSCPSNFSLAWRCLFFRSGFFSWSATLQSIPVLASTDHLR